MYYISFHKQIDYLGFVLVGTTTITPFGGTPNADRGGLVYFRILNADESITDLERFIYIYFNISNFEPTVVAVITLIEIPSIFFSESLVSCQICLYLLIITIIARIACHFYLMNLA